MRLPDKHRPRSWDESEGKPKGRARFIMGTVFDITQTAPTDAQADASTEGSAE